jgi:hypothetical protein
MGRRSRQPPTIVGDPTTGGASPELFRVGTGDEGLFFGGGTFEKGGMRREGEHLQRCQKAAGGQTEASGTEPMWCESPRRRACRPGVWWDIKGPRGVNHGAPWASPISPAEGTRGAIGSGGVIARTRSGRARAPVRGNGGNGLGSEGGDPTGSLTLSVS